MVSIEELVQQDLLELRQHWSWLPNESRLSCGRNAGGRKAVERLKKGLAGEGTQFFPQERLAASSAC